MLDETRMRTECFAPAPQRWTSRLSKHVFLTFQAVTPLSKTRNQLCIFNAGLIPNIAENPRNRKHPKRGRKRLFNTAIHALRMRVERTFAWEDKFKRLLLRFERIQ